MDITAEQHRSALDSFPDRPASRSMTAGWSQPELGGTLWGSSEGRGGGAGLRFSHARRVSGRGTRPARSSPAHNRRNLAVTPLNQPTSLLLVLWGLFLLIFTQPLTPPRALAAEPVVPARVWTDVQGRKITAHFLAADEQSVRLTKPGEAKVFDVPLERLSAADREYVGTMKASMVPVPGQAADELNNEPPLPVVSSTNGEDTIRFASFGIELPVPRGWKIISAKDLQTDIFTPPHRKHADEYIKNDPDASCFIQKQGPGDVKPTICIIPGEQYVKSTPDAGNFRGGFAFTAGVHASQLAWLASYTGDLPNIAAMVQLTSMEIDGKKGPTTQSQGDGVTLLGIGFDSRWWEGKNKWQGPPVTVGVAAPPDSLKATIEVVEQIIRDIQKCMKDAEAMGPERQ